MGTPHGKDDPSDIKMEAMFEELLEAQLALETSVSTTSQFLRFVLNVANENLSVIRTQLETIRDLAERINERDCAS